MMKALTNKILRFVLPALAVLTVSSCVKTDRSHCLDNNCFLQFYYAPDEAGRSVEASELENIHVFMFDQDGCFLQDWVISPTFEDISQDPSVKRYYYSDSRTVDPGSYYFIAWINHDENFDTKPSQFVKGVTTRAEAEFILNKTAVNTLMKPLMYGETNLHAVTRKGTTITVYLNQYSRKINIWMKGENVVATGDTFNYDITDRNGRHLFRAHIGDNSVSQPLGDEIRYHTDAGTEEDVSFGSLSTLRLWDKSTGGDNAKLTIKNKQTGQTLINDKDLIVLIQKAAEGTRAVINFDQRYEYDLYIIVDTDMSVKVGLDDWNYFGGGTDL